MEQLMTHEELLSHATGRCERGSAEVGAAFDRDQTERDRDRACRWRFLIVDRGGASEYLEFVSTGIDPGVELLVEPLEDAVEHFVANTYPAEACLAILKFESDNREDPIVLPLPERYRRRPVASA
jgi:hypothetical protein